MFTTRETAALVLAIAADAIQVAFFPLFGEGVLSPLDDCLDVAMFLILVKVLGWHTILLPTMAAELIPLVDACPTWTLSVLIIAWGKRTTRSQPPQSKHLNGLTSAPPSGPMSMAALHEPHRPTSNSTPQR
jgi:hypothetical protein